MPSADSPAGWGSADIGGAYKLQGTASNYAVDGNDRHDECRAGVARAALLESTSAQNVEVTFRVAVDRSRPAANYIVYAVARQTANSESRTAKLRPDLEEHHAAVGERAGERRRDGSW